MRAYEFVADEPGDWAIHCHKSHHTMNAMGHEVKTFIGVNKQDLAQHDPQARARLHADGLGRHGGDGRDGNADARQHAADDDRLRPVRPDGDGRHVLGGEGARGPRRATTTRTPARTSIRRARSPTRSKRRRPRRARRPDKPAPRARGRIQGRQAGQQTAGTSISTERRQRDEDHRFICAAAAVVVALHRSPLAQACADGRRQATRTSRPASRAIRRSRRASSRSS